MYKAIRPTIGKYTISDASDQNIVSIQMPRVVWAAENAPLNPVAGAIGLNGNPEFEFQDQKLIVQRKLLTNNFVVNFFHVWIEKDGEALIEASPKGNFKPVQILYKGEEFVLSRNSYLKYDFSLQKGGRDILNFKDVTPFFTFTARRDFSISAKQDVDRVLLAFAFFLSVVAYFKC